MNFYREFLIILSKFYKLYLRFEYYIEAVINHLLLKLSGSNYKNRIIYQTEKTLLLKKINNNKKKRLALFVAFHDSRNIPKSNIEYINFLNKCNFDIVYIHNGILSKKVIDKLSDIGCYLICRKNIGQDFGAWKDAFAVLKDFKINNNLEWILICNDSNFCINSSESSFLNKLQESLEETSKYDFLSLNCNFESYLHYQSYFLCFRENVFNSKNFKKFWDNYIPLNNRYHSIEKGERKLTETVLNNFKPKVILNNYDLYGKIIEELKSENFYFLLALLPKNQIFLEKCFLNNSFNLGLLKMLGILESYNPSHIFALTNIYYLKSPFIKKDIVRYGLYSLNQIHRVLSSSELNINKEIINEIMNFYTCSGTVYSYKLNMRKAIRRGVPCKDYLSYSTNLESKLLIDPEKTIREFTN